MAERRMPLRRPPNPASDYKEVVNKQTQVYNYFFLKGWKSSVDRKARRNADASSTPGSGRGPFSQSQI